MNFQMLRRPVPLWFSLVRFLVMAAGLTWIAYDSNFKPVAQELAKAVAEVTGLVQHARTMDQTANQNASTTSTQQSTNGAAK